MAKSWELTEEQKAEFNERSRQIGSQFDPETGKRKSDVEDVDGTNEDEQIGQRERDITKEADDDNVR